MYTTIIHSVRKALNLSIIEYCLVDAIQNTCVIIHPGWSVESRKDLGCWLNLTPFQLNKIINSLVERKVLDSEIVLIGTQDCVNIYAEGLMTTDSFDITYNKLMEGTP